MSGLLVVMRITLRPALAISAVIALAVPLAVTSPAQANTYRPVGERTLANSSLSAKDIPRWMRHGNDPQPDQTFLRGRNAAAPDLCLDDNGDDVTGKRPRQSMESMSTTRVNLDDFQFTEINSNIYQYRTRAAAERAWAHLNTVAQTCAGNIEIDISEDGTDAQIEVNTEVGHLPNLFGTPGLELSTDVTVAIEASDLDLGIIGDQYANYYLAGTSIVRMEFANINGQSRGVGRVVQGFVQSMAIVVAQRVERRSSR